MTWRLKVWTDYFAALVDGTKPFDARRNDPARAYQVGDDVVFIETTPLGDVTGRTLIRRITYVLADFIPDWTILGLGVDLAGDALPGDGRSPDDDLDLAAADTDRTW